MNGYTVEVRTGIRNGEHIFHTWLQITKPDGTLEAWGLHPATDSLGNIIYGPGSIQPEDTRSGYTATSGPLYMTDAQYQQLSSNIAAQVAAPPNYSALSLPGGVECSMWAVETLQKIDLIPAVISPHITPELIPILDALIWNPAVQSIGFDFLSGIQKLFHQAEVLPPPPSYSPLVLDLNGDGVSTVAMTAGVHFDQNNNRFAELSGWVAPSDGLLVRDLNGNGQIDGGGELFGDNTLLASGQNAANGFASLAELDTNQDGTVDSTEATAAGIKIWKDANQNGITDAGELLTLNQAGVSSLATGYTATPTVDAQGNTLGLTGSYTTVNGTVRAMDDVWFAVDTARTVEKDTVAVSAQIAALPDMAGFGNVHSLHQAMARDNSGLMSFCRAANALLAA